MIKIDSSRFDRIRRGEIKENLAIDSPQVSYSPRFSNFGLVSGGGSPGIDELWLHYNRASIKLFSGFLRGEGLVKTVCDPYKIIFEGDKGKVTLSFYDTDCFGVEVTGGAPLRLIEKASEDVTDLWQVRSDGCVYEIRGYAKTGDDRDPDPLVPFGIRLAAEGGRLENENGLVFAPYSEKATRLRAEMKILAPAEKSGAEFALDPGFAIKVRDEKQAETVCRAISGFLFNLTEAPGKLGGYISAFPNRGGYPCHFLWDSCFQNLGLEILNAEFARHSLEIFAQAQREDGKFEQFICSTWARPSHSQPPLLGWASLRLVKTLQARSESAEKTDAFIRKMLPALHKNNLWWENNRMTRHGLIYCEHGLETGQDDSPRFEEGAVLAVDMNSYLLSQIKCTGELADIIGCREISDECKAMGSRLEKNILHLLWDDEKKLFFDADPETGKRKTLVTGSGFLPLWAGVDPGRENRERCIRDHLLNPEEFYGNIPFPCISYRCEMYISSLWWRGPMWPSLAWLMLETLEVCGFEKEHREAARRLLEVFDRDAQLHELYDSQTGKGLGNRDQGWSEGVYLKLLTLI